MKNAGPRSPAVGPDTLAPGVLDAATEVFATHRDLLFSLVHNLLGSVADTEDVLQETWLAWASARHSGIANSRAYLVRIAVNQALARLRRARRERAVDPGPWLPQPLLAGPAGAEDGALREESVSLALTVVLQTLTPLERAVFVLREVFGYDHGEIAGLLGRTSAAVRQTAHRARSGVRSRRPRGEPGPELRRAVTERFLSAALGGDLGALMDVLAPDVVMWTDGDGTPGIARRVVEGRDRVVRLVRAKAPGLPAGLTVRCVNTSREPAALLFAGDRLHTVVVLELTPAGDRVSGIHGVVDPGRLTRVV
ncbi:sigma-70 family RNA polymerase sigma factor [Streptomyces sp. IB2014 016-6]|uniref:sigma-70 family RNA polymerase sigma factor n=1 Tax=Streptomyces sp. IB2014 016-6 TaxID=2517818 RepID=UPI001F4F4F27|nr:sigma-70 family RNA polymerase sigma factor [Streptomyces sp. IB2014 016-6]